jgi:hypothetical protein
MSRKTVVKKSTTKPDFRKVRISFRTSSGKRVSFVALKKVPKRRKRLWHRSRNQKVRFCPYCRGTGIDPSTMGPCPDCKGGKW